MFKTKNSKFVGASLLVILLIGAVIGGIFLSNRNSTKHNGGINNHESEFKKIVKNELDLEPESIGFNYNSNKEELKSVDLYFSKSDKEKHPFLNSSVFKYSKPEGETKEYISTKILFDEKFPKKVTLNDIFKLKIYELTTQIYVALLDKNDIVPAVINEIFKDDAKDPKLKKTEIGVLRASFYKDINQTQTKEFLQNYADLTKLKGMGLINKLTELKILSATMPEKKPSLVEEKKIVNDLLSQPYLYITNVRDYSFEDKLAKITSGKTKVYVPDEELSNLENKTSLRLGVVEFSRSATDSDKNLKSATLTQIVKIEENTYEAFLRPEPIKGTGFTEVRIKTKL